jgi:hypothetical protein
VSVRDAFHERTPVGWAGGEARRGGAERAAIRDLLVERSGGAGLDVAFEAAWATWDDRAEVVLDSGLTYGGAGPVLVEVVKRPGRYLFSDAGAAVEAAGRPQGWRETAERVATEHAVNVSRNGIVFVPSADRKLRWLSSLPGRIAEASIAVYEELLEL